MTGDEYLAENDFFDPKNNQTPTEDSVPENKFDAIRPESADMHKGGNWSECESCGKVVHIDELQYDLEAPVDNMFTHNGHVA